MKRTRKQAKTETTTMEASAEVIRSTRDEKPLHYSLKIQSFSLLQGRVAKSNRGRYESKEFDAGGYKWKLALYPNGDDKRNASDHISLYLIMGQNDILSFTSEVYAVFTFFVYDHFKDQYHVVQDGKVRRFRINTEWGFPQLLSLNTFNDTSNGFLVDGSCVFGVEVFVKKADVGKGELFSFINEPKSNKFTWKIENFSKLDMNFYDSELFAVEGYRWKMRLYPKGVPQVKGEALSLFLMLDKVKELAPGFEMYVHYEMAVMKQSGLDSYKKITYDCWVGYASDVGGTYNFISLKDLMEPSEGFIVNDVLIVEAKINVISTLENFP